MFRHPLWLTAAFAAPALALLMRALAENRRAAVGRLMGDAATLTRLVPAETGARRAARALLRAAAAALLGLALAGPQWGVELVASDSRARSVIVAVDVSASMSAEDVKPNRLEKAKEQLSLLIDGLAGDRVGVIAFAGEAALVCPVTADLEAAKQLLRSLEPGLIASPGTGIGKAVRLGTAALARYPGGKALVVISDGEDHETDPLGAAEAAAAADVRVFGIGVGTPEGGPIPLKNADGTLTGYKKDAKGSVVVTRLGEKTLADVAARASGAYYRASPSGDEAVAVAEQIRKLDASQAARAASASNYKNRFLLPLWLAFLVLLAEALVRERRLAFALLLCAAPAFGGSAESGLRQGNSAYKGERYEEALEGYARAGRAAPGDPRPLFNSGAALYRLDRHEQAADAFGAVAEAQMPAPLRAAAHFNRGNARFGDGRYAEAVDSFRKALTLDPNDPAARHNLAVALRFLKNPPKQSPKNKDDKNKPQKSGDDKKQPDAGGQGDNSPKAGEPKSRPQDAMSREDAERVLRAVGENEKSRAPQIQLGKEPPKPKTQEKDW